MGCIACAALVLDGAGLTLTRKESSTLPVEADSICPDRFVGLSPVDIAELPVVYGGKKMQIGDVFEVDGGGAENVTLRGDLKAVDRLGQGMAWGRLTVTREVGAHLGAHMSGGEIVAERAAGDWVGAHMSGGRIVVEGDAGCCVGAAYPGEALGMRGGSIVVAGNAGAQVGAHMRRGLVVVLGDAGESAGAGMVAGTIVVGGRLGGPPGVGMRHGTIVVLGEPPELPPAFRDAGLYRPDFLRTYQADLEAMGLVESSWLPEGELRRFVDGDGGGEVLVRDQSQ